MDSLSRSSEIGDGKTRNRYRKSDFNNMVNSSGLFRRVRGSNWHLTHSSYTCMTTTRLWQPIHTTWPRQTHFHNLTYMTQTHSITHIWHITHQTIHTTWPRQTHSHNLTYMTHTHSITHIRHITHLNTSMSLDPPDPIMMYYSLTRIHLITHMSSDSLVTLHNSVNLFILYDQLTRQHTTLLVRPICVTKSK